MAAGGCSRKGLWQQVRLDCDEFMEDNIYQHLTALKFEGRCDVVYPIARKPDLQPAVLNSWHCEVQKIDENCRCT